MGYDLALAGNGWNRDFFYANGDNHEALSVPGGALLVAAMLEGSGLSVAPAAIGKPVLTRHVSLVGNKGGTFSVEQDYGATKGASAVDCGDAVAGMLVVWDEAMDNFTIPEAKRVLWASRKRLPPEELFEPVKSRAFLVLSADVLRSAGALVSRQISWERTTTELVWQLRNNPRLGRLLGVPEMLVIFAEDGAVHIQRTGGETTAVLTLFHGGFEGQIREQSGLCIPDAWTVMVAAAAKEWKARADSATPGCEFNAGAVLGPAAALTRTGYVLGGGRLEKWLEADAKGAFRYRVPITKNERQPDPVYWCAVNSLGGSGIQERAFNYVMEGQKAIDGVPRFSCGALTTIDRREIEAFQNIRGLIVDYAASSAQRPLSVAVFGAPGSGKSFGVTQIAKAVLPGVAEKLEFNVSQMVSQGDLAVAFHQVRDVILSGKLPIVFFDEFDSDRDGRPLGWLKSFLMPMQDGKFRDESGEHPMGKCILVFAGGTSPSFEEFCRPMNAGSEGGASPEENADHVRFKNAKGPDFVSRLRGTINVLGPNQNSSGDRNYILRRALLLRSLLERKLNAKGAMPISPDVLRAMLLVPKYKHGARSMEAILDMSHIASASWDPASLPFYTQLSLHVDADAFIRLVLRDVVLNAHGELLARAVHEDYLAKLVHEDYLEKQEKRGVTSPPNQIPWEQLDEEVRRSNREQALDIPKKLLSVGCDFDAGDSPYPSLERFTPEEIMRLAQDEHIRWMAQKMRTGWTHAPVRDNAAKKHPCLVDWEELSLEERQKDIDAAENIIPLLKKAGLRVYRIV